MPIWLRENFSKKILFDQLRKHDENFRDINKIKFSEHHLVMLPVLFSISFDEAIVLTLDGVGECTTTVAVGKIS